MDKQRLDAALGRAQQLINSPEFNRLVESKAGSFSGKGSSSGADLKLFERQAFGMPTSSQQKIVTESTPNMDFSTMEEQVFGSSYQENLSKSKMPEAIKESFRQMPPIQEQISYSQMSPYQRPTVQVPQSGIDYNYIKYLIKEAVTEVLSSKEQLNESGTFKGIKMCGGNKIQLLDTKGNLFEAELKLKKKMQPK